MNHRWDITHKLNRAPACVSPFFPFRYSRLNNSIYFPHSSQMPLCLLLRNQLKKRERNICLHIAWENNKCKSLVVEVKRCRLPRQPFLDWWKGWFHIHEEAFFIRKPLHASSTFIPRRLWNGCVEALCVWG